MSKALLVIDMQNYFVNKHTKELPNKIRKFILSNGQKFDYILGIEIARNSVPVA